MLKLNLAPIIPFLFGIKEMKKPMLQYVLKVTFVKMNISFMNTARNKVGMQRSKMKAF